MMKTQSVHNRLADMESLIVRDLVTSTSQLCLLAVEHNMSLQVSPKVKLNPKHENDIGEAKAIVLITFD